MRLPAAGVFPSLPVPPLGYDGGMPAFPLPPWVAFPGLMRNGHPTDDAFSQIMAWLYFVVMLSLDDLHRYERDHPAPLEWECLYKFAAQLPDLHRACMAQIPDELQVDGLIAKLRQSTTLK